MTKRKHFGSSTVTHTKRAARSARLVSKIANHAIKAARLGKCGEALMYLNHAAHATGVAHGHFVSLGKGAGYVNRSAGRRRSVQHGIGKLTSTASRITQKAQNAIRDYCMVPNKRH